MISEAKRGTNGIYYGWFIVATTFFMSFLAVGSRQGFSLFFSHWREDFGWTISQISVIAAIGTVINALTQPLLGNLYDRFGGKKVIIASLLAFGLGTVGISLVSSLWLLLLLYGIVISFAAGGVSFVTTGPLIARWFNRKRGSAMAIQTAGAPVGGMIIVPFTGYMLLLADWRIAWVVLGLMILLIGIPLVALLVKEDPKEMGLEPDGGDATDRQGKRIVPIMRCAPPLECTDWRQAFKSRPVWQLALAYAVCGVTTTALAIHFVPFAENQGMSPNAAAAAFGLMMGLNVVGVLSAGYFSDRFGSKNLLAAVYFTRGLAYAILIFTPGTGAIWLFACVAGMSWIATVPLTFSLTREIYGIKAMGTLSGIVTMSHQLGGAATIYLAGWAFDRFGTYTPFWITGASLLAAASLLAFTIREKQFAARYQPELPAEPSGPSPSHLTSVAPAPSPAGGSG